MEYDPKTPQYLTSDETSFASVSARDRWPVILTGAIDDLHRTVGDVPTTETEKRAEGKTIIEELAKLKYELQHNRQLTPLLEDGEPDIAEYNEELEKRGNPTWYNVPWLYSECYLYRRLATLFNRSKYWKGYDVFSRQKMSTFKSSRPAVLELAGRYRALALEAEKESKEGLSGEQIEEAEQLIFAEMCEICLWGNATDLSLLTSLTYEDIQKLQGSEARKASEKNILVNDMKAAYDVLRDARKTKKAGEERRVDIVLDNAGFELFVDLILAGYLLSSGLATTVVLRPKVVPWFVSDVIPKDFADLLNALAIPQAFYTAADESDSDCKHPPLSDEELKNIDFLFSQWSTFHAEGKLVLRPHRFWTAAGSYWRLPKTASDLHEDLQASELVLFKGDLNYRKLTSDAAWDPTTTFTEAIGPLGPKSGVRILSFRTCKADVVVGLQPGEDERLRQLPGGGGDSGARKWAWSGKWAVVSFCDGKK
ncbi:hypothetical protein UA08_00209 [Talaromyces atroroseus]|uniref:Sugar phosphate phosphatase n=1 Tax=Talaromyces atroroseus TaxID=1441469 RepID=A0A225AS21_TALAT|nr:hypothetical protein UA08_00209 [Talaromyces atroroseus]OKL63790.1 hypothetical protein UA08_00209 [Talaromyces atroroseus]